MKTIRLTTAQALIQYLQQQYLLVDGKEEPIFAGAFAIFGHGNVAGLGEALYQHKETFPTYRAHNEQGMAHAAIAFAKQKKRRQMIVCTTSIGPGATNMVTAAALAHVNRLPVLLLPGDTFASRTPDPVLQQLECFSDPTISVNDCFKPVSRYFDRISRPEQLINSLPVALRTLLDPVDCGPVTLSLPQDVQAQAFDFPAKMFEKRIHRIRRPGVDEEEISHVLKVIRSASRPLIIAGGGVHYSLATDELNKFSSQHQIPVAETQAGKGALNWKNILSVGGIGVTGSKAANELAREADVIIAIGTRLQDFTTESRTLFNKESQLVQINIGQFDVNKHDAIPLLADCKKALQELTHSLSNWKSSDQWTDKIENLKNEWHTIYETVTADSDDILPSDAQVLGAIKRQSDSTDVIVCAAGGLPGELHKLWRCDDSDSYHVEYGFSCMGYEIAGGLGVKMASPEREVFVVVGDGSYMMMNSELATSVMMGHKIIVITLDNRGFGCINRLQQSTGNQPYNNLLDDCHTISEGAPKIDFAAHARAMGAQAESVQSITELEQAIVRAKQANTSYLISIDTDPNITTDNGDSWWDVAIPQISENTEIESVLENYQLKKTMQPY
ncbi:MAG: 3D-(3,5/4)-trihydroxycyclohexane-1,2-dione acylhydrolase (decyclizing) [Kangiellaceae bacterium]|nr:3D-(3,5/4)-trihydroxycyclohexane-1,2-dione acylhydrolase (decyclizing) [Kangiellaceae bacterium]